MCVVGYGRNNNGECVLCGVGNPNCASCDAMNISWCGSCALNYDLVFTGTYDSYCRVRCINICRTCSGIGTNCTLCYDGYYLTQDSSNITTSTCLPCGQYWQQCSSNTNCTICYSGYILNSNICTTSCSPNCRTCQTTTTNCTSCHQRMYLNIT